MGRSRKIFAKKKMLRYAIWLVAGARPNLMKIAPLWRALQRYPQLDCKFIYTGQHYDKNLSSIFFSAFGLPKPYHNLKVRPGSRQQVLKNIREKFIALCKKETPSLVVVVGDVNSTLGATRGAKRCRIPIVHVEAGLRSFDPAMPEELNRRETDHLADHLFASERSGVQNLLKEGISRKKIFFPGNVMIDTLVQQLPHIRKSAIDKKLHLKRGHYVVATLHRPSNVDSRASLLKLTAFLSWIAAKWTVVFPLHPRTKKSLIRTGLLSIWKQIPRLILTPPLGYPNFLGLVSHAKFVVTDSGGIQEETTYIGIPCFTLRDNTERPSTIYQGTNLLLGTDMEKAKKLLTRALHQKRKTQRLPPRWDGKAAVRIAMVLIKIVQKQIAAKKPKN